jgi:hypothetical protein
VNARLRLRILQNNFVPSILVRNFKNALRGHNLKWIDRRRFSHSDVDPGVVADVYDHQRRGHAYENSFRDWSPAIHVEREQLRRNSGVGDGVRTHDPRSHSPMFYR